MAEQRRMARLRRRGVATQTQSIRPIGATTVPRANRNTSASVRARQSRARRGDTLSEVSLQQSPTNTSTLDHNRSLRRNRSSHLWQPSVSLAPQPQETPSESSGSSAAGSPSAFLVKLPLVNMTQSMLDACEEESCCICMEDYAVKDRVRILPCFHRFHANCIGSWVKRHNTCPLCNETIFVGLS